jgi:uncharacterized integral membrane protein
LSPPRRRPAGPVRKILAAIILVPLAVVIVALAVANRQNVTLSFDPFNPDAPAASQTLPLFVLIIMLLIAGALIGGAAAWLRQRYWRRHARWLEQQVTALRSENDAMRAAAAQGVVLRPASPSQRLQIRPPAA